MLESMRKHMTWMMWVIVGLITVTFLFFGIYPSDVSGRMVAKVGGDVITADEYNRAYRNLSDTYRELLKGQLDESLSKGLRTQALQELIVGRLLTQEAARIGLRISDGELQSSIMKMPSFARNGKFDKRTYDMTLDRVNMTPAAFEASQREYLLRQKLERIIKEGVMVSDAELMTAYQQKNPKAKAGEYEKNKETFASSYLAEKRRDAMTAYVRGIQNKTAVTIEEKALAL